MKNTFGNSITLTIFGESHGNAVGAVIDGLAPGLDVDLEYINKLLAKRRPFGNISTSRIEADELIIESGVFEGKTTGTPICIVIPNTDTREKDYDDTRWLARPSHADYTANCKYHGFEDYRGGGHFSGRITAAIVAAGGIIIPA
ncbi:MAG: chorismate synthase, partial [Clostridia bacterium]|nr:chorismate synthase [Clostridia bacterium]